MAGLCKALETLEASLSLQAFAKDRQLPISHRMKWITQDKLDWGEVPHFKVKAADIGTCVQWLAFLSTTTDFEDDDLSTAIWCVNEAMKIFMKSGFFLTPEQAEYAQSMGLVFIRTWLQLAARAISKGQKMFKVRPKLHLLHHVFLCHRRSRRNPGVDICFMDEDFIKHITRISAHTHKSTMALRTIQRYLAGLRQRMEKNNNA